MVENKQSKILNRIKRPPIEILKLIALLIILGFATQVVASFILTTILDTMPDVASQYNQNISAMLELTPRMLLFVCVIAPLCEELFFRGLVLGVLRRFAPFIVANITQAIAFGIYHGNVIQGVYAFLLGIFIGFLVMITGSVGYTVVLHMSINLAGVILDKIIPEESSIYINVLVAVIAFVVGGYCLNCLIRSRRFDDGMANS